MSLEQIPCDWAPTPSQTGMLTEQCPSESDSRNYRCLWKWVQQKANLGFLLDCCFFFLDWDLSRDLSWVWLTSLDRFRLHPNLLVLSMAKVLDPILTDFKRRNITLKTTNHIISLDSGPPGHIINKTPSTFNDVWTSRITVQCLSDIWWFNSKVPLIASTAALPSFKQKPAMCSLNNMKFGWGTTCSSLRSHLSITWPHSHTCTEKDPLMCQKAGDKVSSFYF